MTDDTRDPPPGAPRKRPTPTIDLTATEIPTAPQSGGKTADADRKPDAAASQDTTQKTTQSGPSMSDRRPFNIPWPAAVAAGAAAIVIFVLGLWAGFMSGGHDSVAEKVVRLPETPGDAALVSRIAALEAAAKAAADNAAGRDRRSDEIAVVAREARSRADAATTTAENAHKSRVGAADIARADLDMLAERIAALEQATRLSQSELARRPPATDDPKSRLAIAAATLRDAVERGHPFASELAAAKSLAADPKLLAPLEEFAVAGVPTNAALARELSALLPAMTKAGARGKRDASFLERLQANAEKLVRIRPVGDVSGDEPDQILARVEARVDNLDIGGALSELGKLPAAMRAPAGPWIKKAETRNAALAAAREFSLGALAGIGKSGS